MRMQVLPNAQELAGMQETSRNFMRDGQALQADLERLKADLTMLHAQAQLAAAAAAPLLSPPCAQVPPLFRDLQARLDPVVLLPDRALPVGAVGAQALVGELRA